MFAINASWSWCGSQKNVILADVYRTECVGMLHDSVSSLIVGGVTGCCVNGDWSAAVMIPGFLPFCSPNCSECQCI